MIYNVNEQLCYHHFMSSYMYLPKSLNTFTYTTNYYVQCYRGGIPAELKPCVCSSAI